jgi:hypothetical protein
VPGVLSPPLCCAPQPTHHIAESSLLIPPPPSPAPAVSELGLGTTTVTNFAAQVPRSSVNGLAAIAISAGKRHTCAVFEDNTVRLGAGAFASTDGGLQ